MPHQTSGTFLLLPGQFSGHVTVGNQDICGAHVYDQAVRYGHGIEWIFTFHCAYQ